PPASAQHGLRYLSWPGKPARPTAPAARSAPAARPTPTATPPAPPAPVPPAPAPQPPAAPPPPPTAQSTYGLVAPSPYAPERRGLTPATMMPIGPADPHAPRADAPIFRMSQPAAAPAAPIAPPGPAPGPVRTAAASTPPAP